MGKLQEFRKLLAECGVECTIAGYGGGYVKWQANGTEFMAFEHDGALSVCQLGSVTLTPEEAIYATLGLHRDLNTEGSHVCPDCGCVVDYDTRGDGEKIIFMEDYVIPLNHCPKCGRRIEVDE